MSRSRLYSRNLLSKPTHATLLGTLFGLLGFLLGAMSTTSVRLRYTHDSLWFLPDPLSPLSFALYAALGCLFVGGVVAFLYERYQTVTPPVLALLVYLAALSWTSWQIHTWPGPSGVQEPISPVLPWVTIYEYILLGWPLVLVGLLLVAGFEHRLKLRDRGENRDG